MFRPSKTTGLAISCFTRAKSGWRNSFHSVTRKSASAPSTAAYGFAAYWTRAPSCLRAGSIATGSWAATTAPSASSSLDEREGRRGADVVRLRLEREPPHRDLAAAHAACRAEVRARLLREEALLPVVHGVHRGEEREIEPLVPRDGNQRLHVLGEAGPAIAHAGEEEGVPDPLVRAQRLADRVHVRADALAQVRHLVDEADAHRQHGVGGVLGQLRRGGVHEIDGALGPHERRVELGDDGPGALAESADHDAVRALEIVDRGPFLEELRVGHHL